MNPTDQIAAEAADEFSKGLPFGLYLKDKAELISIIKSAIEKAKHMGYLEGHKAASEFARTVQEERNAVSRAAQASEIIMPHDTGLI